MSKQYVYDHDPGIAVTFNKTSSHKILQKMCFSKLKFKTKPQARKAATTFGEIFGCEFEIYKCPVCCFVHLKTKKEKQNA